MEKEVRYIIKSYGPEVEVSDLKVRTLTENLPLKEQVSSILHFLNTSVMCTGFSLSGNDVIAMMPHKVGIFKYVTSSDTTLIARENSFFSQKCQLISSAGTQCSSCRYLKKIDKRRKKRKKERNSIHKKCNKRYLNKEEINAQLTEAQKNEPKHLC